MRTLAAPRAPRGFTLLEVMVALAILGLGITTILSAQGVAFAESASARNIGMAVGLARCKMSELEEHLTRNGFQELEEIDSGPCCDGDETPGMTCSWRIEKPVMPEPSYGELDLDANLETDKLGALGALATGDKSALPSPTTGATGLAQALAGTGDPSAGGMPDFGGITSMAMNLIYPDIRTLFEASTRRITVTLTWTERGAEQKLELAQWVANPQQSSQLDAAAMDALGSQLESAADGASGSGAPSGGSRGGARGGGTSGGMNPEGRR